MADRYHIEAWSLPLATSVRIVARVPFIKGKFGPKISAAGRGAITVRKDWDRLSEVTDPQAGTGSLFRIYQNSGTDPVFSFFGRRDARNLADAATDLAVITGPGIGDVMNYARVENFDYPIHPTVDPDWSWGAGGAIRGLQNGSMEKSDPDEYDIGTGFEDETNGGWSAIPASEFPGYTDLTGFTVNNVDPRTGTFGLIMDPGDGADGFSGIFKIVPAWGGEQITVTLFTKEVTTGQRIIAGIGPFDTFAHTNGFTENGIAWAELDNDPEGTGSSDGTYQQVDLDITTAGSLRTPEELRLYLVYADTSNVPAVRLDDVAIAGFGIGLHPWEPAPKTFVVSAPPTTFERDTSPPVTAFDGSVVMHIVTPSTDAGSTQFVEGVTVGRTYAGISQIHHDEGSNQDFLIRMRRASTGEPFASATVSVPTGGTWTEITVEGEAVEEDIFLSVLKVTAGEWWTDGVRLIGGLGSASWGDINTQLFDDAAVDHVAETPPFDRDTLGFLDYTSHTDLLDSAGNAWAPAKVEYRAPRGKKLYQVQVDGSRMGFEWQVIDLTATGPRLDLFNPYDWTARTGGMGINRVGTDVPALRYGPGVVGGPIVRQPSTANRFHIEGEGGLFEVRRDTASIGNYDTREYYEGSTDFLDSATIGQVADQALTERTIPTTALKVQLDPNESDDVPVPFRDFDLGDTYPVDLIGDFTGEKRVVGITADITPGFGKYTIEFDQATYTTDPQKAVAEAVRRLMEQAQALPSPADTSRAAATVTEELPAFTVTDSYLVASKAHSRVDIIESADVVTDQDADQVEIQSVLDSTLPDGVPGSGSSPHVILAAGRYEADGTMTVPSYGTLEGTGRGSNFDHQDASLEFVLSTGSEIARLTFIAT